MQYNDAAFIRWVVDEVKRMQYGHANPRLKDQDLFRLERIANDISKQYEADEASTPS